MTPSRVRLTICGTDYQLTATESEEYLRGLARKLDGSINQVISANPGVSVAKAAVFVALGYLDELEKNHGTADNLRDRLKEYLDDAAQARLETRRVQEEKAALENKIQALTEQLEHLTRAAENQPTSND